jgi:hypothetical protein
MTARCARVSIVRILGVVTLTVRQHVDKLLTAPEPPRTDGAK